MNIPNSFLKKYYEYFSDLPSYSSEAVIKSVYSIVKYYTNIFKNEKFKKNEVGNTNFYKFHKNEYTIEEVILNRLYANVKTINVDPNNDLFKNSKSIAFYDKQTKQIILNFERDDKNIQQALKQLTKEQLKSKSLMEKISLSSIVHELLHAVSDDKTASFVYNNKYILNELITDDIAIKILGLNKMQLNICVKGDDDNFYIINSNCRSGYSWGHGIAILLNSIPNINIVKGYIINSSNSQFTYDNYVKNYGQTINSYKIKNAHYVYFEGLVNLVENIYKNIKVNKNMCLGLNKVIKLQADLLREFLRNKIGGICLKALQGLNYDDLQVLKNEIDEIKHVLVLKFNGKYSLKKSKYISDNNITSKNYLKGDYTHLQNLIKNNIIESTENVKLLIEIERCINRLENENVFKIIKNNNEIKSNNKVKENTYGNATKSRQ